MKELAQTSRGAAMEVPRVVGIPRADSKCGGGGALAAGNELLRSRQYQVQHPAYLAEHPIWGRSPAPSR